MAMEVTADKMFLNPAAVKRLVDAINERRAAAIATGATGLPDALEDTAAELWQIQGTPALKPLFLLMQEMLEALAVCYVEHGATVPAETLYTVTTWRAAAGLHEDGFRRAAAFPFPDAPAFGHGLIQDGDVLNYWILDDIMAGVNALRWTRKDSTPTAQESRLTGTWAAFGVNYATAAEAAAKGDEAWQGGTWVSSSGGYFRACAAWVGGGGSTWYSFANAVRAKHAITFSGNAPVAGTIDFYGKQKKPESYSEYGDFAGAAEGVRTKFCEGSFAAAAADCTSDGFDMAAPTDTPVGTLTNNGALVYPPNQPESANDGNTIGVIKWTFAEDFET